MKTLGEELKEAVLDLDLTPVEACVEVGVSIPTLYSIYNGGPLKERTVNKVKRALERLKQRTRAYSKAVG